MDDKGQSIFLSIIGIATLLVAIIGATFAWFSINVSGNENPANIGLTSPNLGQVNFNDGVTIDIKELVPAATGQIKYNIVLNVESNTLTPNADGQFVYSLSGTGNTNGGTLAKVESKEVPTESTIIGSGVIEGYEVHTYEYTIGLNYIDADQNAAQGKEFNGYLSVQIADESKYPKK